MTVQHFTINDNPIDRTELFETLIAPGVTASVRLQGRVVVQLSGTATAVDAVVEHATQDPTRSDANWAPAEPERFTGSLVAGLPARTYTEPALGFWRLRVVTLTGGNCQVSIVGEKT